MRVACALAEACTPVNRAANYTQAIMDLGASVCTRANPDCRDCPVAAHCAALDAGRAEELPSPRPKRARDRRETVFVMVVNDGDVLLQRRPDQGVWGGLWCFPETDRVADVADWCRARVGVVPERIQVRPPVSHSFRKAVRKW